MLNIAPKMLIVLLLRSAKSCKPHLRHHIILFMLTFYSYIFAIFNLDFRCLFLFQSLLVCFVASLLPLLLRLLFILFFSYLQSFLETGDLVFF